MVGHGVVGHREVGTDSQQLEEQPPKSKDEVLALIGNDVSWGAMFCEDL